MLSASRPRLAPPMPTHCPACKKPVPTDAHVCPYCPMIFGEDEGAWVAERGRNERRHLPVLGWLVLIAALTYGAWQALGLAMRLGDSDAPAPARPQERPAAGAKSTATVAAVMAPDLAPQAAPVARPKAPALTSGWHLSGTVYDLWTLKPLAGASIEFDDLGTKARFKIDTDAQGRYQVVVPPLKGRGYTAIVWREGFAGSYLNPGTEGVAEKPQSERQQLCGELVQASAGPQKAEPYSVEPHEDEPLVTDFYLAPLRRP